MASEVHTRPDSSRGQSQGELSTEGWSLGSKAKVPAPHHEPAPNRPLQGSSPRKQSRFLGVTPSMFGARRSRPIEPTRDPRRPGTSKSPHRRMKQRALENARVGVRSSFGCLPCRFPRSDTPTRLYAQTATQSQNRALTSRWRPDPRVIRPAARSCVET